MTTPRRFPWMSDAEAIERLQGWAESFLEQADHGHNQPWLFDLAGDVPLRATKHDQDSAFGMALDYAACLVAIDSMQCCVELATSRNTGSIPVGDSTLVAALKQILSRSEECDCDHGEDCCAITFGSTCTYCVAFNALKRAGAI